MKKTTINAILISIIAIMSISICFLIFCIATRPRYIIVSEPESAVIVESAGLSESENVQARTAEPATEAAMSVMHGKASAKVNIRDSASEGAKVLETVEEGTTFDIIEIMGNGWTKITYQEGEAYISSSFVIVLND